MLRFERVTISYGERTLLRDADFSLVTGCTALTGPSGVGKSSFLRVMAGGQVPTNGVVTLDGRELTRVSWTNPQDTRVFSVHQDYRLVPFLSVAENLRLAAELHGTTATADSVAAVLDRVSLSPGMASRAPASLSGGEQQRVAIARALTVEARYLLADEPTGALDRANSAMIGELLRELGAAGMSVLIATHDRELAGMCDSEFSLVDAALERVR